MVSTRSLCSPESLSFFGGPKKDRGRGFWLGRLVFGVDHRSTETSSGRGGCGRSARNQTRIRVLVRHDRTLVRPEPRMSEAEFQTESPLRIKTSFKFAKSLPALGATKVIFFQRNRTDGFESSPFASRGLFMLCERWNGLKSVDQK